MGRIDKREVDLERELKRCGREDKASRTRQQEGKVVGRGDTGSELRERSMAMGEEKRNVPWTFFHPYFMFVFRQMIFWNRREKIVSRDYYGRSEQPQNEMNASIAAYPAVCASLRRS